MINHLNASRIQTIAYHLSKITTKQSKIRIIIKLKIGIFILTVYKMQIV